MPILVSGGVSQLNRSGAVVLVGQQPTQDSRRTCNRLFEPQTNALPFGYYEIAPFVNMLVQHKGGGEYRITKYDGAAAYDADAVGVVGIPGDFILRLQRIVPASGSGWFGGGMDNAPTASQSIGATDFLWAYETTGPGWYIWENGFNLVGPLADSTYAWIWRTGTSLGYGRGATLAAAQASPDRTTTSSATLYFDSFSGFIGTELDAALYDPPKVLTADAGAYTLTGTAVGAPALTRRLVAAVGSYAVTGTATRLLFGHRLVLTPGAYAITGTATTLRLARRLVAAVGAYSISGQAVALKAGRTLALAPGSYSIAGQAVGLKFGRRVAAAVGSYTISGQAAGLLAARSLVAAPGSYTLNGQTAGLYAGRALALAPGAYVLDGQAVTLTYTPVFSSTYTLNADAGAYAITGVDTGLLYGRLLGLDSGSYALTGVAAAVLYGRSLSIQPGMYNYYGQTVGLTLVQIVFVRDNAPADVGLGFPLSPPLATLATAVAPSTPPALIAAAAVSPPEAFVKATAPNAVELEA